MTRFIALLLAAALCCCSDDSSQRKIAHEREQKKRETVFREVSQAWKFNATPINLQSQNLQKSWGPWRIFLGELGQKPQSTIGAFRDKTKLLATRVLELREIPQPYDRPEIRSRISVLITKINELDLYVNLDRIPADKVKTAIEEINVELASLQMQMAEIVRRSQVPREQGEPDLIRMRDTSRAIPGPTKSVKFE